MDFVWEEPKKSCLNTLLQQLDDEEDTYDVEIWRPPLYVRDHPDSYRLFSDRVCQSDGRQCRGLVADICRDSSYIVHNLRT